MARRHLYELARPRHPCPEAEVIGLSPGQFDAVNGIALRPDVAQPTRVQFAKH